MELTPIFITGIVFLAIYKIIEVFVRRKERLTLIEKITELPPDLLVDKFSGMQSLSQLLSSGGDSKFTALKWGLFAIGIGAGCVISTVMALNTQSYKYQVTYMSGCVLLGGGLGLLIAFIVEYCLRKKENN